MPDAEWEPSCFYTGFNGPLDPGYALTAQSSDSSDPLTLKQALKRTDWDQWHEAINTELTALEEFDTFEVVTLPTGGMFVLVCILGGQDTSGGFKTPPPYS